MTKHIVQRAETLPDNFGVRAEVRVKNAALVEAREKLGLTQREAAEAIGIAPGTLGHYENMMYYPSEKTQRMICKFYRRKKIFLMEEDVFPEELMGITGHPSKYIRDVLIPRQKILSLSRVSPKELPMVEPEQEVYAEQEELRDGMRQVLDTLGEREKIAVTMRYGLDGEGERTYEEIGEVFKVTGSQAKNIADKATRKMHHPVRSGILAGFLDTDNPQEYVTKAWYNR